MHHWSMLQVNLVNESGDGGFLIFIYEERDLEIVEALLEKGYKIKQENHPREVK